MARHLVLLASVLALAGLAGCGAAPEDDGNPLASEAADATPSEPADATPSEPADATPSEPADVAGGCAEEEHPPVQAGSHLIGDAEPPQPYSSTPPTSGWHSSGALDVAISGEDDPLTEPEQVSVLEADGVVITYRDLPEDEVEALAAIVRDGFEGRVALTPYDGLEPGQVALTAWGVLQRCDGVDAEAVRAFAEAHASEQVHPGH